ncbi:MAG TPA: hypothetical protein VNX86_04935 [Rhizomicrobium sp.]|jgi:hypothetical protein|nr:hypothetical protein [Rhizomicrobium sp.]
MAAARFTAICEAGEVGLARLAIQEQFGKSGMKMSLDNNVALKILFFCAEGFVWCANPPSRVLAAESVRGSQQLHKES